MTGPVLIDADGRAVRDLVVPTHPGEPHIGVSVPAGALVPDELRDAVTAMQDVAERAPRHGKG